MSHQGLYGEQVHAVLIQVGAKSMAERVAGKPAFPAQSVLMRMDMPGKEKGIDGPVLPVLFREEVSPGLSAFKPVLCQDVKGGRLS